MAGKKRFVQALVEMIAYLMMISPVMASDSPPSAQYINIEGSRYEVSAGKVIVDGVEYTAADGIVTIDGTDYSIISEFAADGQTTCIVRAMVASSYCVGSP